MVMDERTKDKISAVTKSLENERGSLRLLACVWREDLKNWNVIVSADWVDYDQVKENIGDIFDVFKKYFNGEFALRFSGIHPLETEEPFVQKVTELFEVTSSESPIEIDSVTIGGKEIDSIVLFVSRKGI